MTPARWLDLGLSMPEVFHATYAALAEAGDGRPALLWGRCPAHICLGQSQDAQQELQLPLDVPVVRRVLGGGAVWIDEHQYCFAIIAPLHRVPSKPEQWFAWALAPMRATYWRFGLPVECVGRDLWCRGRKIAGSGAATIDGHAVLASSFLLRFPAQRFAACIASPTPGFRQWLGEELCAAMTDWESHAPLPQEGELAAIFRQHIGRAWGWDCQPSMLDEVELAGRKRVLDEHHEWHGSRRLVPHGVKLNARSFLTERCRDGRWARVLTRDGVIARLALSCELPAHVQGKLEGCPAHADMLRPVLGQSLPAMEADCYARLIAETAYWE